MKKSQNVLAFFLIFLNLEISTTEYQLTPAYFGKLFNVTQETCRGFSTYENTSMVSQSQINNANDLLTKLQHGSTDFHIQQMIETRTIDQKQLIYECLQTNIPWIIFLVLSLLVWLLCSIFCLSNMKGLRNFTGIKNEKYKCSKIITLLPLVFSILFALIIVSSSIAGLIFSESIGNGIKGVRCSMMQGMDNLIDPSPDFIGLNFVQEDLEILSDEIVTFINRTEFYFNSSNQRSKKMQQQQDDILVQIDKMSSKPIKLNVLGNGQNTQPYESYYYQNNVLNYITGISGSYHVGPEQQNYLQDEGINSEYIYVKIFYGILIQGMDSLEQSAVPFFQGQNLIQQIQKGVNKSANIIQKINQFGIQLYEQTHIMNKISDIITYSLQAIFGVSIAAGSLVVIGAIIITALKQYRLRILIHIGWCVYCFIMILGFLSGIVFYSGVFVSSEACDYYYKLINNQTYYQNSTLFQNNNAKDVVNECLYGDGDLLQSFGVKQTLDKIQKILGYLKKFQMAFSVLQKSKKFSPVEKILSSNLGILQSLGDGTIIDQDSKQASNNIETQISQFNKFSDQTNCVQLKRHAGSCTDGSNPIKSTINPYQVKCWHPVLLSNQSNFNLLCDNQRKEAGRLKNWFLSQSNGWAKVVNQQIQVIKLDQILKTNIWDNIDTIQRYQSDTYNFLTFIADPQNMFVKNLNCSVLRPMLQRIYNGYCVLFTPVLYRTTIIILILSVAMFFGSISTCCLGVKFQRVVKKKIVFEMAQIPSEQRNNIKQSEVISRTE